MAEHLKTGRLNVEIQEQIATLTFGHPAGNSFPSSLLKQLTETLDTLSNDAQVHVIVLQSEGNRAFCAGASFDELVAIEDQESGTAFFSGFAHVINAMRRCKKIIIGRVQGKTVGGGVGLAAACDYVLATEDAAVKLSELTIGIGPFVIAPAVERKIGLAGLSELSLTADRWKDAQWAKNKGLYSEIYPSITALDDEVKRLATALASYSPQSVEAMKSVLWENTDHWDTLLIERAKISGKLVQSEATKKALAAFKK